MAADLWSLVTRFLLWAALRLTNVFWSLAFGSLPLLPVARNKQPGARNLKQLHLPLTRAHAVFYTFFNLKLHIFNLKRIF
jgi:hypothetical protein